MKRIDEIVALREELNNEIDKIKKSCKHQTYDIGIYSWRVGSYDLVRMCTECYSVINGITDNESEEYYAEMHKNKEQNPTTFVQGRGSIIYTNDNENINDEPQLLPVSMKIAASTISTLDLVEVKPSKPFI